MEVPGTFLSLAHSCEFSRPGELLCTLLEGNFGLEEVEPWEVTEQWQGRSEVAHRRPLLPITGLTATPAAGS